VYGVRLYHEGKWLAVSSIVARLSLGDRSLSKEMVGDPFHPSDEGIFSQCLLALEGIVEAYWEDHERAPRLREMVATIEFVLCDDYCSDPEAFHLEEIAVVTRRVSQLDHLWTSVYALCAKILEFEGWW